MENTQQLTDIRKNIDKIDHQIVELLNARAQASLRARLAKGDTTAYRPEREAEVLRQVSAANGGPLSDEAIREVFKTIIYICRSIQDVKIGRGA